MATKKTSASKKSLSDQERKRLLALGEPRGRPDVAVRTLLHEARDLVKTARSDASQLASRSDLPKTAAAELEKRASLLERAEDHWDAARQLRASPELTKLRREADAQKRAMIAALRYFKRGDDEVQARLDEIVENSGDADLIDDCRRLANLADAHDASLKKARLTRRAGPTLRALAEQLGLAVVDVGSTPDQGDAIELRNRAFWFARELMDEIRAAGRYVFSDDPRKLAKYRSTLTYARARTKARTRRAGSSTTPAPDAAPME